MVKRKTAEQAQDTTPATASATPVGGEGQSPTLRDPGIDSATQQAAEQKKSSWAARTTIAVPLTEEAKRDHTKGEVARYIDGYSQGVGARIDSPDQEFRPSEDVKGALKEAHPHQESMRWNKKDFHKKVTGKRPDGSERSPVAERLDAEDRFTEMVQRRREEIEKTSGGKDYF